MENMSEMAKTPQPIAAASDVSTSSSGDSGAPTQDEPAVTHADLITTHDLSPNISRPESTAASVSVASMIDSTEFRSHMPEPTYQTLNVVNGRMSPSACIPQRQQLCHPHPVAASTTHIYRRWKIWPRNSTKCQWKFHTDAE